MAQSIEWYHALETMKVPTKFVVYPNEGHLFYRPGDARDYTLRTLQWFEQWFAKEKSYGKSFGIFPRNNNGSIAIGRFRN